MTSSPRVSSVYALVIELLLTRSLGGSAKATGELVTKLGGKIIEYVFFAEIPSLDGRSKLDAPVYSIVKCDKY